MTDAAAARATHDHGAEASEIAQNGRKLFTQIRIEDAQQLVRSMGWIGERSEQIENGAHAQFTPDGCDMFHAGMMILREHEPDAGGLNAARDAGGVGVAV